MSSKQSTVLVFVLLTKKWFSVVFRHEQFLDTYQKMITILGINVKKKCEYNKRLQHLSFRSFEI